MMDCREAQKLIMPYIEGSLDSAVKAEMRKHLDSCASCREEYESILSVSSALRNNAPQQMMPMGDLWAKVSSEIGKKPARKSPWWYAIPVTAVVSAVVLVAVFSTTMNRTVSIEKTSQRMASTESHYNTPAPGMMGIPGAPSAPAMSIPETTAAGTKQKTAPKPSLSAKHKPVNKVYPERINRKPVLMAKVEKPEPPPFAAYGLGGASVKEDARVRKSGIERDFNPLSTSSPVKDNGKMKAPTGMMAENMDKAEIQPNPPGAMMAKSSAPADTVRAQNSVRSSSAPSMAAPAAMAKSTRSARLDMDNNTSPGDVLNTINRCLDNNDKVGAEAAANRLHSMSGVDQKTWFDLGKLEEKMGRTSRAIEAYRKATDGTDTSIKQQAQKELKRLTESDKVH